MSNLNIAGYQFIELSDLPLLAQNLRATCAYLGLKGTILLSPEGINLNLAGLPDNIQSFLTHLRQDVRFEDIRFHETFSAAQPFKRLKIKQKKEIITFRQKDVNPINQRAPSIAPAMLKQWLDEKRDITLLDTRNNYEIEMGKFKDAVNLHLNDFCDLAKSLDQLDKKKPLVMYCTGGIRCEKAALYLQQNGFHDVYQLDGGILGYFNQVGGAHYEGSCFVFDERIAVDTALQPANLKSI